METWQPAHHCHKANCTCTLIMWEFKVQSKTGMLQKKYQLTPQFLVNLLWNFYWVEGAGLAYYVLQRVGAQFPDRTRTSLVPCTEWQIRSHVDNQQRRYKQSKRANSPQGVTSQWAEWSTGGSPVQVALWQSPEYREATKSRQRTRCPAICQLLKHCGKALSDVVHYMLTWSLKMKGTK